MTDRPRSGFHRDDVEVVAHDIAFQRYFRIDEYKLRHRTFRGDWSAVVTREVFERGHVVVVLPYDPLRDEVVLIEQFRPGAYAASRESSWFTEDASPWLIECVAGVIEDGEDPDAVARRETVEEVGLEALDLKVIRRWLVSPGGTTESVIAYAARIDAAGAGGLHGLGEEDEDIRVFALPAEEAFRWVDDGRVLNAATLIALDWLRMNREALRAAWA